MFEKLKCKFVNHIYMQMSSLKFVSIDDLVGFPSLRLGFGGFSQLTAGFSDQHAGFSHLTAGFSDQHAGFYYLTAGFSQKKSFFRLGFLNKNQLGRAGSSFLRKRYINTIPFLL